VGEMYLLYLTPLYTLSLRSVHTDTLTCGDAGRSYTPGAFRSPP
jgi:hypothetical protein